MEIVFIITGCVVLALVARAVHARINREPPQTHSNAKPTEAFDQKAFVKSLFIGIPPAR